MYPTIVIVTKLLNRNGTHVYILQILNWFRPFHSSVQANRNCPSAYTREKKEDFTSYLDSCVSLVERIYDRMRMGRYHQGRRSPSLLIASISALHLPALYIVCPSPWTVHPGTLPCCGAAGSEPHEDKDRLVEKVVRSDSFSRNKVVPQ